MTKRLVLLSIFLSSGLLVYLVVPTFGCGVQVGCTASCFDSNGNFVQSAVCSDSKPLGTGSCECYTDYEVNGNAFCHALCTSTTGEDRYCSEL